MNWNSGPPSQFPPPHWNAPPGVDGANYNPGGFGAPPAPGAGGPGSAYPGQPSYPSHPSDPNHAPPAFHGQQYPSDPYQFQPGPAYPGAPSSYPGGPPPPNHPGAAPGAMSPYPGSTPGAAAPNYPGAASPYPGAAVPPYSGAPASSYPGSAPGTASPYPGGAPGITSHYPGSAPGATGAYPGSVPPPGGAYPTGPGAAPGSYPGGPTNPAYPGAPSSGYPAPGATSGTNPGAGLPNTAYTGTPSGPGASYYTPPSHPGAAPLHGAHPQAPAFGVVHPAPGAAGAYGATMGYPNTPVDPNLFLGVQVPELAPHLVVNTDYTHEVQALRKALGGFRTDKNQVIGALVPLSALQMGAFKTKYATAAGTPLINAINKETSGWLQYGLRGLVYGPVEWDTILLQEACARPGTKESAVTEILLNRTNAEITALKDCYQRLFRGSLTDLVLSDLSLATKKMFQMALLGTRETESAPVHTRILADMDFIDKFGRGIGAGDNTAFCSIMITRSFKHLVELSNEFHKCHGRPIRETVEKKFTGHMRDGLLFVAKGVEHMGDGVERDAEMLMAAMKGMGTNDQWLVWRVVRAHWDKPRWARIIQAFAKMYNKSLYNWVDSETSGAYKDLMLALIRAT